MGNFQINTLLSHGTVGCLSSRRTRDHGRNSSCSPIGYWGLHGERVSSGGISHVSKASCYFFFAIDANSFDLEVWVLNTKASCPSISENPHGWNDGWRIFPRGAKPSNRLGEHSEKCKPLSWKKKKWMKGCWIACHKAASHASSSRVVHRMLITLINGAGSDLRPL